MLPKFIDAPGMPTLNIIMFNIYTGYPLQSICYMNGKGGS